jgi:hypothetical protein
VPARFVWKAGGEVFMAVEHGSRQLGVYVEQFEQDPAVSHEGESGGGRPDEGERVGGRATRGAGQSAEEGVHEGEVRVGGGAEGSATPATAAGGPATPATPATAGVRRRGEEAKEREEERGEQRGGVTFRRVKRVGKEGVGTRGDGGRGGGRFIACGYSISVAGWQVLSLLALLVQQYTY